MWPFSRPIRAHSRLITLCLLDASLSLKIKFTHSVSLLCCCNYKSSLSLWAKERGCSRGLWVRTVAAGGSSISCQAATRPPPGIKRAQATGEWVWSQAARRRNILGNMKRTMEPAPRWVRGRHPQRQTITSGKLSEWQIWFSSAGHIYLV